MSRFRVLQLISGIAIGDRSGGAERHAIQVAGLLDREVYESRIFAMQSFQSPQEGQWLETFTQQGLPVEGLIVWENRLTADLYRVYKKLRSVTTDFKPDIIHSHSERADILGMLIHLAHTLHPLAFRTVHLDQQWITQPLLGSVLSRLVFPFSFNQEIAVSEEIYTKLSSRKFSQVDKISLCYNGINASQFETTPPPESDLTPMAVDLEAPLVGIVGRLVHAVIPPLVPSEAHELIPAPIIAGEMRLDIGQHTLDVLKHLRVVRPDLAATARRTEIHGQTLAAPRRLDQQPLLLQCLTNSVAKPKLRADGRIPRPVPRAQAALAVEVPYPHVIAHDPLAVGVDHVRRAPSHLGVLYHVLEAPLASIPVRVHLDLTSAFHIGLARQNEYLQFPIASRLDGLLTFRLGETRNGEPSY